MTNDTITAELSTVYDFTVELSNEPIVPPPHTVGERIILSHIGDTDVVTMTTHVATAQEWE